MRIAFNFLPKLGPPLRGPFFVATLKQNQNRGRMKTLLWIIAFVLLPIAAFSHSGGLNKSGCHNNRTTGDYHCHRGNNSTGSSGSSKTTGVYGEAYYNNILANNLDGQTEVSLSYEYGTVGNIPRSASVRIDIMTDEYVIEGGLDKRSSLDSIQQAVFAATLTDKKPAVAIYDTDGQWGKYEHRIWQAAQRLGIRFIWVSRGKIIEK